MPIDFVLGHKHLLVLITMRGEVGIADIVTSAHKIMAISDVGGYNTIADICNVDTMPQFSAVQLNQLALLFLGAYPLSPVKPRLLLMAANDAVHGIARSFEDYCDSGSSSHKRVGVSAHLTARRALCSFPVMPSRRNCGLCEVIYSRSARVTFTRWPTQHPNE